MAPHTHIPAPRNTIETYSARPEREPPRNENGEIICNHDSCREKNEIFRRPCEWNKHMDKHERPYKCNEPTCEQNPGFTYSGGLLRHMREVHKKGVGPARRPLFCPHANCIRSTGEGFTRKENLEEHLRRRHSYTGHYSPPPQSTSSQNEDGQEGPRVKRRKTAEPDSPNGDINSAPNPALMADSRRDSLRTDLHAVIDDRLHLNGVDSETPREEAIRQLALARQEIQVQQERLRQQDHELYQLRVALQNASGAGIPYSTRQPERASFGAAAASVPLSTQMRSHEPFLGDSIIQAPLPNGADTDAPPITEQDARQVEEAQAAIQRQGDDKDSQTNGNGNEPSRRIEIDRDLVSEKLAQKPS